MSSRSDKVMKVLARYQRDGGFIELLSSVEMADPRQKEKLLSNIENENYHWANEIRDKMLNVHRILSWPNDVINTISSNLPDEVLATFLCSLRPVVWERFLRHLSPSVQEDLRGAAQGLSPSEGELNAATAFVIQKTRELVLTGKIPIQEFDYLLEVQPGIEEILQQKEIRFG